MFDSPMMELLTPLNKTKFLGSLYFRIKLNMKTVGHIGVIISQITDVRLFEMRTNFIIIKKAPIEQKIYNLHQSKYDVKFYRTSLQALHACSNTLIKRIEVPRCNQLH